MSIFSTDSRTTLAEIKKYHSVGDTESDLLITQSIELAGNRIIRYCNRDFESKARAELPLIEGRTDRFFINENPVAFITSIIENGITLVENTDYFVEKETGSIIKKNASTATFGRASRLYWHNIIGEVRANYTGGLFLPDGVVWVFLELVGIMARIKEKAFIDNEGVNAVTLVNSLPKSVLNVLNEYRKVNIC